MTKKQLGIMLMLSVSTLLISLQFLTTKPRISVLLTPLELAGLYVYQKEGCMHCHSRVVRPLRDEHARYGDYSSTDELAFFRDKFTNRVRIGPDLARVGGKYSDTWLVQHFLDPRSQVGVSNMPAYPWLVRPLNLSDVQIWMQQHPYPEAYIAHALSDIPAQLTPQSEEEDGLLTRYQTMTKEIHIRNFDGQDGAATELDALIAYLQSLEAI